MTIFYTPLFVIVFVLPAIGTQTEEKTLVLIIFLATPTNKKSGLFLAHSWTHGHVRLEVRRRLRVFTSRCMAFVFQGCFLMKGVLRHTLLSAHDEHLVCVMELKTHLSSERPITADGAKMVESRGSACLRLLCKKARAGGGEVITVCCVSSRSLCTTSSRGKTNGEACVL